MLSPLDLGLKPGSWRPNQEEAIDETIDSDEDVVIIDAPTGSGKSVLALGIAQKTLQKTFVLTHTKSLQAQYMDEANGLARTIMGKANYRCSMWDVDRWQASKLGINRQTTVDIAPCASGFECPIKNQCTYFVERRRAIASPISIHNYAYWLPESTYVGGFRGAGYIIADEGHLLDGIISDFESIDLSLNVLNTLNLEIPDNPERLKQWVSWAQDAETYCWDKEKNIEQPSIEKTRWRSRALLLSRLATLPLDDDLRRVVEWDVRTGLRVRPVWPSGVRKTMLDRKGNKLVIMSGTILDPKFFSQIMNIPEYKYIKLPWTFPAGSRPIYYRPAAKVTRDNMVAAAPNLSRVVDYIIDAHGIEKGVIHSRSFDLGRDVYKHMKLQDRVIFHERGQDTRAVVERFKRDHTGKWLLSPSVSHGEDFAYDIARCQVILKMPYPDLHDPVVRIRARQVPAWYYYKTAQDLVQEIGRVSRAMDDYGETWIIDSAFEDVLRKFPQCIPEEIREAIV